ncbi:MAG TPA: sigma-70 family RNA polymerase sigma factor [Gemmataceae bacterium]|nr:sigma-70 family RNA polymerase sigma factor [Gemmataceae bacterium]
MTDPRDFFARKLAAARDGSPEALGEALEACRLYLLGVADRELDPALKPKGGASDLVQETFLEAQRDFAGFGGDSEAELLAWLRRLLLNNLANFARHYRQTDKRRLDREVGLDPGGASGCPGVADDTPSPSGRLMADERAEEVRRAVERLPEEYRRVLTLRYQEDRPFEEIGKLMGRTSNAVRKLWARAVERLEQELGGTT